jgi:hypothetical protein
MPMRRRSQRAVESRSARRALAFIAAVLLLDWLLPDVLYGLLAWATLLGAILLIALLAEALITGVTEQPRRLWRWSKRAAATVAGASGRNEESPAEDQASVAEASRPQWEVRLLGGIMTLLVFGLPWAMWGAGPIGNHNAIRLVLGPYTALVFLLVAHLALLGSIVFGLRWPPLSARRWVAALGAFVLFEVLVVVAIFAAAYVQAFREHSSGHLACFTAHSFSHLDALYFTVGTLSTAGTGTIATASQFCRGMVTIQMLVGVGVLGVLIAGVAAQLMSRSTDARTGHDYRHALAADDRAVRVAQQLDDAAWLPSPEREERSQAIIDGLSVDERAAVRALLEARQPTSPS